MTCQLELNKDEGGSEMTRQKFEHAYQDDNIGIRLVAENPEDVYAHSGDLMDALQKIVRCAGVWDKFHLHINTVNNAGTGG